MKEEEEQRCLEEEELRLTAEAREAEEKRLRQAIEENEARKKVEQEKLEAEQKMVCINLQDSAGVKQFFLYLDLL